MVGDAQVHVDNNEIHDSPYAVVMNPGCAPDIGDNNEISCTSPTGPCLFWGNMDPAPAPAPDMPVQ
jgi:hypothetical protein